MNKLKFSGRGIGFLSHYMAKQDIRYYLNGICLRPLSAEAGGGVLGAATNGHVMGLWHDPDGQVDREVILKITPELVRACSRRVPKKLAGEPMLTLLGGRLACMIEDAELYIQPNEYRPPDPKGKLLDHELWEVPGKFPHVGRVVPDLEKVTEGPANTINAIYLELIAKSLPNPGKWGNGIIMRQAFRDGSILVLCEQHPQAAIVLMPMRDECEAPRWLHRFVGHDRRAARATTAPLPVHEPSDAGPPDGDGRGWALVTKEAA